MPGAARLALGAVENGAIESFRALRGMGRLAASPRGAAGRVAGTLRRAALGAEDVLRPAPAALVNSQIGPRRTLVRYATRMERLKAVKRAAGVTLNDVCLAAVAGAMRELALERRVKPAPLKVMVPVSVRQEDERLELGNRISFAFIDLPVHRFSARQRLAEINRQTSEFKRAGRPEGVTAVMNAVGLLPAPLKGPVARAAGSARVYNLTVSNIPGPGFPLYMLGAQLDEAYPIVPLSEGHALSIGIFSYRDDVFFGIHAEPFALPEARLLPEALDAAIVALGESAGGVAARRRTALRLLPATANGGGP